MAAVHTAGKTTAKAKFVLARPLIANAAAENAAKTAANFPLATLAFNCTGFDTVLVGVKYTTANAGTVTLEAHTYDAEGDLWLAILDSAGNPTRTPALDGTAVFPLKVYGRSQVLFRVHAIANAVTNLEIIVAPGDTRVGSFF